MLFCRMRGRRVAVCTVAIAPVRVGLLLMGLPPQLGKLLAQLFLLGLVQVLQIDAIEEALRHDLAHDLLLRSKGEIGRTEDRSQARLMPQRPHTAGATPNRIAGACRIASCAVLRMSSSLAPVVTAATGCAVGVDAVSSILASRLSIPKGATHTVGGSSVSQFAARLCRTPLSDICHYTPLLVVFGFRFAVAAIAQEHIRS
jgi:hypothetical protein